MDSTLPGGSPRPGSSAVRRARDAWRRLLSPACTLCGTQPGDPICGDCQRDFLPEDARRCGCCALALGPGASDRCGRCLRDAPPFDWTLALADYAAPIDGLIVRLKFGHRLDLARALGTLLGRALARRIADGRLAADAPLLPVPLAFERQRERGFNQAQEIARAAAAACGLPLNSRALLRVRHQPPQEGLSLDARRRNVRGAFVLAREAQAALAGGSVVVVDDVMTSGSTLAEVASVLRKAGVSAVGNAVVARTP